MKKDMIISTTNKEKDKYCLHEVLLLSSLLIIHNIAPGLITITDLLTNHSILYTLSKHDV